MTASMREVEEMTFWEEVSGLSGWPGLPEPLDEDDAGHLGLIAFAFPTGCAPVAGTMAH